MREHLARFFTALGYFTRLPVPAWVAWSPERLAHAAAWLPLVGWVIGLAGAAALHGLALVLPASLAVILSMATTIRLTGALHEDGFADGCDGLGGGWDKAQILAIMKDSRIGSYGAIGIVLMLLAKAAALIELAAISPTTAAIALLVAHPLSRLAATSVLHALPYARSDDSSKAGGVAQRVQHAAEDGAVDDALRLAHQRLGVVAALVGGVDRGLDAAAKLAAHGLVALVDHDRLTVALDLALDVCHGWAPEGGTTSTRCRGLAHPVRRGGGGSRRNDPTMLAPGGRDRRTQREAGGPQRRPSAPNSPR